MSVVDIIPIVIKMVLLFLIGFAWSYVCAIIYSGIKGGGHNIGPTYGSGFGSHHPGGIILSDEEREVLKVRSFSGK